MTRTSAPDSIAVEYFDGRSARAHPVRLQVQGTQLHIRGEGIACTVPIDAVRWPERQRHAPRVAHLPDGASLHASDTELFDAFARAAGVGESMVVRAQQSWRATAVAVLALLVLAAAGYAWGLPLAARGALALVPPSVDRSLGEAALDGGLGRWLQPSALPPPRQQQLREAFARAVERAYPAGQRPLYEVRFHASRIGPNAFALPGGIIVLTDELVQLLDGRDDVVLGVLAHELGHVRHRHGMRSLVQVALLGTVTGIAFGDFSTLLAGAPLLLGQMAYSRDFEREADAESVHVLRAAGHSPDAMVVFFERARQWQARRDGEHPSARDGERPSGADGGRPSGRGGAPRGPSFDLPIALASHPADAERIRFFRDAARR